MRDFLKKMKVGATKVVKVAFTSVKNFCIGVWRNAEGIAILTLAASGLSALLGEVPFWLTLPFWLESPMVIPVIAVIIVWLLTKSMERRYEKRHAVVIA